ncbi:hypothetical protein FQN57_000092 [Myotisia sp. PD_48]|nr:hypothetical protein FQN57_000092 [Myotisia sp. PD_48]
MRFTAAQVIFLAFAIPGLTMTTGRSAPAAPEGAVFVSTREELNKIVRANPETILDDVEGGFQLVDMAGKIKAVATGQLVPELKAAIKSAEAAAAKRELDGTSELTERAESEVQGKLACSHPRCFNSATCLTYTDCHPWTLADSYSFISAFLCRRYATEATVLANTSNGAARRHFHDYFVTHLPVSSLHPDSRASAGPNHQFPRAASTPHSPASPSPMVPHPSPASVSPSMVGRETTVVRIPLRSAKHHFGASVARGMRPYTEDTYQAGVIELPAFARRAPLSVTFGQRNSPSSSPNSKDTTDTTTENKVADSVTGDPQVFYFGVFDGHGGAECSEFLRDRLHSYIQDTALEFELESSLSKVLERQGLDKGLVRHRERYGEVKYGAAGSQSTGNNRANAVQGDLPILQAANRPKIGLLERNLVKEWKDLVGGYFRRFKPLHFSYDGEQDVQHGELGISSLRDDSTGKEIKSGVSIEEVVEYAFLRADLDFVSAQVSKPDEVSASAEKPLNDRDILHRPSTLRQLSVGGKTRFNGGSTGSIAMISTPTPMPFWNPAAPSSLLVSHVGDTRILMCSTATGLAVPLTTDHHPSSPVESSRLQRYAATFVTDSFGEERMSGLANTRAFGDIQSKRIGVSAEPEIRRIEIAPAEYSFMVLMSDGVSGTLSDQEVVDIVKEARTPDQGARDVVSFATEVSADGDNATCLVVRLGGWERRLEGGLGSMGTKESRDWRSNEAAVPRSRRQ